MVQLFCAAVAWSDNTRAIVLECLARSCDSDIEWLHGSSGHHSINGVTFGEVELCVTQNFTNDLTGVVVTSHKLLGMIWVVSVRHGTLDFEIIVEV